MTVLPPANIPGSVPRPNIASFFTSNSDSVSQPKGNNDFSRGITADVQTLLRRRGANSARSRQTHLGPSEIGHPRDRQVAAKLAGLGDRTQADGGPSIVGTAVHASLADAFAPDDPVRWGADDLLT